MKSDTTTDVATDPYDVDPAWDLDRTWTEAEYLNLDTNRLVEFVDGIIEFLPMATLLHQLIVGYLYVQLHRFVAARGIGTVVFAPFPIHTRKQKYREPDLIYLKQKPGTNLRLKASSSDQAELVMEVVSDDDRRRDLLTKRREYAQAGIPEYWIVDPREETITVLTLIAKKKTYAVHGLFKPGDRAVSVSLPGFEVAVTAVLDQSPEKLREST